MRRTTQKPLGEYRCSKSCCICCYCLRSTCTHHSTREARCAEHTVHRLHYTLHATYRSKVQSTLSTDCTTHYMLHTEAKCRVHRPQDALHTHTYTTIHDTKTRYSTQSALRSQVHSTHLHQAHRRKRRDPVEVDVVLVNHAHTQTKTTPAVDQRDKNRKTER